MIYVWIAVAIVLGYFALGWYLMPTRCPHCRDSLFVIPLKKIAWYHCTRCDLRWDTIHGDRA